MQHLKLDKDFVPVVYLTTPIHPPLTHPAVVFYGIGSGVVSFFFTAGLFSCLVLFVSCCHLAGKEKACYFAFLSCLATFHTNVALLNCQLLAAFICLI